MEIVSRPSPVEYELACSDEELERCKVGEYIEDANGTTLQIKSVDTKARRIRALVCVSESFTLPPKR